MISIIVPVYNVAGLLPRCIESIQAQTYTDWELILIDDGSKDGSLAVCERYAAGDSRIRVFPQTNRGVSETRNRGISLARGRYLQFIDSDDSIEPEMLRQMHSALERDRSDVAICGYLERSDAGERPLIPEIAGAVEMQNLHEACPGFFANPLVNSPCNKLYKRELIDTTFPAGLSMGEDLLFNLAYLRRCSRLSFVQQPFYLYEKQEGGLSSRERMDTADIAEKLYLSCMEFAADYRFGDLARQQLATTFVQFFCYGISSIYRNPQLSPDRKKHILSTWAKNPNLCQALHDAKMPQLKQRVVQTLLKAHLTPVLHLLLQAKS